MIYGKKQKPNLDNHKQRTRSGYFPHPDVNSKLISRGENICCCARCVQTRFASHQTTLLYLSTFLFFSNF